MKNNVLRVILVLALITGYAQVAGGEGIYDEAFENFVGLPPEQAAGGTPIGPIVDNIILGISESFPISSVTPPMAVRRVGDDVIPYGPPGMGPLQFAERATTQGRGMMNVSSSFTYIDFDKWEGTKLSDLQWHNIGPLSADVSFDVDVQASITAVGFAYGVLDNLDVAVVAPWVTVDFDNRLESRIEGLPPSTVTGHDTYDGLGDILVRTKLLLAETRAVDFALGFDYKTDTGDEDKLLGTGYQTYKPFLIMSKGFGRLVPHLNIGYSFADAGRRSDEFTKLEYAVGCELVPNRRFTAAVDVIGSHKFLGNDDDDYGENIVNVSAGFKWAALQWGAAEGGVPTGNFVVYANAIMPLNDDGARAEVVPTTGIQVSF